MRHPSEKCDGGDRSKRSDESKQSDKGFALSYNAQISADAAWTHCGSGGERGGQQLHAVVASSGSPGTAVSGLDPSESGRGERI